MKISIFLLLLLDVHLSKEQQTTERSGEIVLKFDFPPYYNSYKKSCSKGFPRQVVNVMDNRGFVSYFLRERLTLIERSGSIEFRIANAQSTDGGYYRCSVDGTQYIYKDFTVEISEPSWHAPVRPTSTVKPPPTFAAPPTFTAPPTFEAPPTFTAPPTSTAPPTLLPGSGLPPDCNCGPFGPWTVNELLITGASIATIALAGYVTAVVVCCRRKKSKNKVVESQPDSSKPKAPLDAGSVIYSAVLFKPHPPPPVQLYDNFRDPVAGWTENVEYGTLALSQ
ncbi:hypothetical protein NHX12_017480 [Muraenolepis orangiensis]|uniref:Immunoglobulin subtype domain-containing protein n=1 Tax=Muraenolepis orangiensis TaxID=630683 RepID=A0A9Q0D7M1_9TELE|nr:hypothetical protein NHX12_017480 [Muraenolepis orangiensis]